MPHDALKTTIAEERTAMELSEYIATYERLRVFMGATAARQIVDELDDERTAAKAEEDRIRAIVRQELGLA